MKRILAGMLAIVLVVASVEPLSRVLAETTTSGWIENSNAQLYTSTLNDDYDGGLSFETNAYNYYYVEDDTKVLETLPATYEATVRLKKSVYRGGTILSNATYEDSGKYLETTSTFAFGLHKNNRPYLYISDGTNVETGYVNGTRYYFKSNGDSVYEPKDEDGNLVPTWVHITIVNDVANQEMRYYENGQHITTLEDTYYDPTNWSTDEVMAIGADYRDKSTAQFNGDIKNVAIYSDVRNSDEIQADYIAMKDTAYTPTDKDGLMACYALNLDADYIAEHDNDLDLYPRILTDLSGNGYDMVPVDWLAQSEMDEKGLTIDSEDYSYSMAVIGDPQMNTAGAASEVTSGTPVSETMVAAMFDWVGTNADNLKMKFAFNLGDTTNSDSDEQWAVGAPAVKLLDQYNVPYSIIRGNHDSIEKYNTHFSYEYYKDSIAGSFDDNMLNTYQKFAVGDMKYMVLNLDFGIGAADTTSGDGSGDYEEVLAWAKEVVSANPDYNIIVTTHAYTAPSGEWLVDSDEASATNTTKSGYQRACNGQEIYEQLISLYSNIVLVISGHVGTQNIVHTTREREDGSKVVELLVNPQDTDYWYSYSGIVSMLYFSEPDTTTGTQNVKAQYYSVLRDKYYLEENQNVTFTLDVVQYDESFVDKGDGSVVMTRENVTYDTANPTATAPVSTLTGYEDYLFAGWYVDVACEVPITDTDDITDKSYAKFWPSDILTVKMQMTEAIVSDTDKDGNPTKYDGKHIIRFVSSLSSLDFSIAGFEVETKDGTYKAKSASKKTFYSIDASTQGSEYTFSPKVISNLSEYFITAKLPVEETDTRDYIVKPYWKTYDGTVVYGDSRCVSLKDNNAILTGKDVLNLTVNGELSEEVVYTASFTSSPDNGTTTVTQGDSPAAVEVLNVGDGYTNVRVTLPDGKLADMASLTKIMINDTDIYGMYRCYDTTHTKGTVEAPHADMSWYYETIAEKASATEFVIASSADLYGFAKIVNNTLDNFNGKIVTLIRDVQVNKGTAVAKNGDTAAYWKVNEGELTYTWTPIGKPSSTSPYYSGTFDGDGNTISGLVRIDTAKDCNGLFASSTASSSFKNICLTNSYFKASKNYLASIVGFTYSTEFENLFSDIVLEGVSYVGGIIGRSRASKTNMEQCWFDGNINVTGASTYVGGLVGQFMSDTVGQNITNCLFTGKVDCASSTSATPYVGGIFGGHQANTQTNRVLAFESCLVYGTINVKANNGCSGEVVGRIGELKTILIDNCYSLCDVKYTSDDGEEIAVTSDYGAIYDETDATQWSEWTITDTTVLNNLIASDGVWATVEGMDVPVLAEFAHTWQKLNNNN